MRISKATMLTNDNTASAIKECFVWREGEIVNRTNKRKLKCWPNSCRPLHRGIPVPWLAAYSTCQKLSAQCLHSPFSLNTRRSLNYHSIVVRKKGRPDPYDTWKTWGPERSARSRLLLTLLVYPPSYKSKMKGREPIFFNGTLLKIC